MGNARKVVVRLLTKLDENSAYSNILLDDCLEKGDLSPQDKKFASALFYGVLERQLTLDEIIKEYSKNPANKLNSDIRNILRSGIYQQKSRCQSVMTSLSKCRWITPVRCGLLKSGVMSTAKRLAGVCLKLRWGRLPLRFALTAFCIRL